MTGNNKAIGNFNHAVDLFFSNNAKQYTTMTTAVIDKTITARNEIKTNGTL